MSSSPIDEHKTDWRQVIADLVSELGSKTAIANESGIPKSTVSSLGGGGFHEPGHARGQVLLAMHKKHCKVKIK